MADLEREDKEDNERLLKRESPPTARTPALRQDTPPLPDFSDLPQTPPQDDVEEPRDAHLTQGDVRFR